MSKIFQIIALEGATLTAHQTVRGKKSLNQVVDKLKNMCNTRIEVDTKDTLTVYSRLTPKSKWSKIKTVDKVTKIR